jgi:hypothetical protein
MASTYSALKIELIGTGEQAGTWGTTTDINLGDQALGAAITGSADVNFATAADVTITLVDANTAQSARNLRLNITESSTGIGYTGNLILGSGCQIKKLYLINNNTTASKTIKNTTGTGISIPANSSAFVYNDATNVVQAISAFGGTGSVTLPAGTTAERTASPVNGSIRYNTSLMQYEGYSNGAWGILGSGSGGGTLFSDTITATQSQTLFTLPISYVLGGYNLSVYVNGSRQIYNVNYTETSTTSFTFATGLNVGDLVNYTIGASTSLSVNAASVLYNEGGTGAVDQNVEQKLQESVSVKDFGAVADGTTPCAVAFNAAASAVGVGGCVIVPYGTYNLEDQVGILDGQTWIMEGAILQHFDDTKIILRANSKTGFSILGKCFLVGTRVTAATTAETGLYITGGKKYRIEGVEARNFKGKGIWLDGANPSGNRGDRGQFTDCAAYDSTVGRQIDAGAEYTTWSNFNASGCVTGDLQGGGNVVTTGGNIVDNTIGVDLVAGSNHLHGMHVGVNINHNTTYNIQATNVTNGHDFIGCHLYGNGSGSGALFFNNSKGICVKNGHLDCWIYNYTGASSGYNYVTDMYCPGGYGDVQCLDASSGYPTELIVQQCYGAGAYILGVSINDSGPVYAHARRAASSTQSLTSGVSTQLVFPDVQANGNRRGAYNATTGAFTVPTGQAGQYRITANLIFSGTAMSATTSYVDVKVGGALARTYFLVPFSTTLLGTTISHDIYLNASDIVAFFAYIVGTSPAFGTTIATSSFTIERIA